MDNIIRSKLCVRCQQEKPLSDFRRCKTGRYNRHNFCKICHSAVGKERYQNNREQIIADQMEWNAENIEKTKRYKKRYGKKIRLKLITKDIPPAI